LNLLKAEFPTLTYIESKINKGFSGGCNIGIKYALEKKTEYVLLLNNDTEVEPDFLNHLVKMSQDKPKSGMIGGKIFYHHDRKKLWDAGGIINWKQGHGNRRGGGTIDTGIFNKEAQVEFVTGCMMLIKREVLERVGHLPECYFFGVEEWDYGVQVSRAGYELWYNPKSVIYHKVGGSHSDLDPVYYYNFIRGRILFMKRNSSAIRFFSWKLYFRLYTRFIKLYRHKNVFSNHLEIALATKHAFRDSKNRDEISKIDLDKIRSLVN